MTDLTDIPLRLDLRAVRTFTAEQVRAAVRRALQKRRDFRRLAAADRSYPSSVLTPDIAECVVEELRKA